MQSRPIVALRTHGVEYVEVRTLDLNLTDPVGINQNQLRFLEALLIYCLLTHEPADQRGRARRDRSREILVRARGPPAPPARLSTDAGDIACAIGACSSSRGWPRSPSSWTPSKGYASAVDATRDALHEPATDPIRGAPARTRDRARKLLRVCARAGAESLTRTSPGSASTTRNAGSRPRSPSLAEASALERSATHPLTSTCGTTSRAFEGFAAVRIRRICDFVNRAARMSSHTAAFAVWLRR